jgi:geranylgeranyl diphosphate synthase type II
LTRFGEALGRVFQIVDDIQDVTGLDGQAGKPTGHDAVLGRLTYPSVFGLDGSRREAARLLGEVHAALEPLGEGAARLRSLCDFVASAAT